jgi:hypothetical protein
MHSYSIGTVLDLRRKVHAVIGERRRTNANETEKGRHKHCNRLTPTDHCLYHLASPPRDQGDTRRLCSKAHAPDCRIMINRAFEAALWGFWAGRCDQFGRADRLMRLRLQTTSQRVVVGVMTMTRDEHQTLGGGITVSVNGHTE